jgi:hypothetical protein
MSEPERVYQQRQHAVGWRHTCENIECQAPFTSKRRARYCSGRCRASVHNRENRRARDIVRELDARTGPAE